MKKIITLIIILMISSCASRKVNLEKSKTVTDAKTETLAIEKTDTKTEIESKSDVDSWIETIEPIDSSKSIVITNVHGELIRFKNAKIVRQGFKAKTEIKKNINVNQLKKSKTIAVIKKVEIKKSKQIEKTYCWWNLLWLLLPIGVYYLYRKYR